MASTNAKNLASGTLASAITASATSITVKVGASNTTSATAVWPSVPFYATIMPASPTAGVPNSLDSEIVKVTAVSYNSSYYSVLTVTRAQRGTTGKAFNAGAIITNAHYTEDEKGNNYYTIEVDTGYTWIDGKTIYKKTIEFGALPNNSDKAVNLNISNLGMVIRTEAFCVYPNGINFPIPFTNVNDVTYSVMMNYTATQVVITTKSDRSGATGYITIYYTKTS